MYRLIKQLYPVVKQISFLLAGALIGITATLYGQQLHPYKDRLILVSVLLILIGIGFSEGVLACLYWFVKKINSGLGFVCVYAPYAVDENNSSWVEGNLQQICNVLDKNKIRYKVSKSERAFKEYPVILNPFGGNYPEKDFSQLTSLQKIFQYVTNGGSYINIADIPFYYAYDENLKRSIDTTPLADGFSLERPFLKSILTQKLNHYVWGIASGKDLESGIARVIQLTHTSKNLFSKTKFIDGPQGDYTPVIQIPYGNGLFLFSTLHIDSKNVSHNILRIVKPALGVQK